MKLELTLRISSLSNHSVSFIMHFICLCSYSIVASYFSSYIDRKCFSDSIDDVLSLLSAICVTLKWSVFLLAVTKIGRYVPQIEVKWQSSAAADNFRKILQKQLGEVHAAGTYKNERVISSPQNTVINIEGSSKSVINFCANNYLGMSVSNITWTLKLITSDCVFF